MTALLTIALVVAVVMFTLSTLVLVYMIVRGWREDRRWERERERIAAHHERMAAQNGRPRSGSVTLRATRRR